MLSAKIGRAQTESSVAVHHSASGNVLEFHPPPRYLSSGSCSQEGAPSELWIPRTKTQQAFSLFAQVKPDWP